MQRPRDICREIFRPIVLPSPSPNGYEPVDPRASWINSSPSIVQHVPMEFAHRLPRQPWARVIQPQATARGPEPVYLLASLRKEIAIIPPHPGFPKPEFEPFIHQNCVFSDGSKGAFSPWKYPQEWAANQPWNGYHTLPDPTIDLYFEASANAVEYFDFSEISSDGTGGRWIPAKLAKLYVRRTELEAHFVQTLEKVNNCDPNGKWLRLKYGQSLPFYDHTEPDTYQSWACWAEGREWVGHTIAYVSVLLALSRWCGESDHLCGKESRTLPPSPKYMGVWIGSITSLDDWRILWRSSLPLYGLFVLPSLPSGSPFCPKVLSGELHADEIYREDAFGAVFPPGAFGQKSHYRLKDAYETYHLLNLAPAIDRDLNPLPVCMFPTIWKDLKLEQFQLPSPPLSLTGQSRQIAWKLPFTTYLHQDSKIHRPSQIVSSISESEKSYRNWCYARCGQISQSMRSPLGGAHTCLQGSPLQRYHPVEAYLPKRLLTDGNKHRDFLECTSHIFYWAIHIGKSNSQKKCLTRHVLSNGLDSLYSAFPWPSAIQVAPPSDPNGPNKTYSRESDQRVYLEQEPTEDLVLRMLNGPDIIPTPSLVQAMQSVTGPSTLMPLRPLGPVSIDESQHGNHENKMTGQYTTELDKSSHPHDSRQKPGFSNRSSWHPSRTYFRRDQALDRGHTRPQRDIPGPFCGRSERRPHQPRNHDRSRSPPPRGSTSGSARSSSNVSHAAVQAGLRSYSSHSISQAVVPPTPINLLNNENMSPPTSRQSSSPSATSSSNSGYIADLKPREQLSTAPSVGADNALQLVPSATIPPIAQTLHAQLDLSSQPAIVPPFQPSTVQPIQPDVRPCLAEKSEPFPYTGADYSDGSDPNWLSAADLDGCMQYEARRRLRHHSITRLYLLRAPAVPTPRLVQCEFRAEGSRHPWKGTSVMCYPIRISNVQLPDLLGPDPTALAAMFWLLTRCGRESTDHGIVLMSAVEEANGTWCFDVGYRCAEDAFLVWVSHGSRPDNQEPWIIHPVTAAIAGPSCLILPQAVVANGPALFARIATLSLAMKHEQHLSSFDTLPDTPTALTECTDQMVTLYAHLLRMQRDNNAMRAIVWGRRPMCNEVYSMDLSSSPPSSWPVESIVPFIDANKASQWSTVQDGDTIYQLQTSWWPLLGGPIDANLQFPAQLSSSDMAVDTPESGPMVSGQHGNARRKVRKRAADLFKAYHSTELKLPIVPSKLPFTLTPEEKQRMNDNQKRRQRKKDVSRFNCRINPKPSQNPTTRNWVNKERGTINQPKEMTYKVADDEFLSIWDWYELCELMAIGQRRQLQVGEGAYNHWMPFNEYMDDEEIISGLIRDSWAGLLYQLSSVKRMMPLYGDEYARLMGKVSLRRQSLNLPVQ